MRYIFSILVFLLLALTILSASVSASDDFIIDGNIVYIEDSNVILEAYPHTLTDSGYVTFNATAKTFKGSVDFIWGFNSTYAIPISAELYRPHNISMPMSYSCNIPYWYNYTVSPKHMWCWRNVTVTDNETNEISEVPYLIFDHGFDSYDLDTDTVYWSETYVEDYIDIHDIPNKVSYDYGGMDTWYYTKNVSVTAGTEYSVRTWLDIPVNRGLGKYWFCVKPTAQSINQALTSGTLYCLDPWWDSNREYMRNITVYTTSNLTGYPMYINILNTTNIQPDCSDIKITDEIGVSVPYWIESCATDDIRLWFKGDFTVYNDTYHLYYGNVTIVTDQSDGESVFPFFDDFSGHTLNMSKWQGYTSGAGVSDGILTFNGSGVWEYLYSSYKPTPNMSIVFRSKFGSVSPYSSFIGYYSGTTDGHAELFNQGALRTADNFDTTETTTGHAWVDTVNYYRTETEVIYGTSIDVYFNYSLNATHTSKVFTTSKNISMGSSSLAYSIFVDFVFAPVYVSTVPTYVISTESVEPAYPQISFIAPTPDDTETVQSRSVTVNLSIIEDNLDIITLSWNSINETMAGTYVVKDFGADGIYIYYVCANNTAGRVNCTETRTVTSEYLSYQAYLESIATITSTKNIGEIPAGAILGLTDNVTVADGIKLVIVAVIIGFGIFGYTAWSKRP